MFFDSIFVDVLALFFVPLFVYFFVTLLLVLFACWINPSSAEKKHQDSHERLNYRDSDELPTNIGKNAAVNPPSDRKEVLLSNAQSEI